MSRRAEAEMTRIICRGGWTLSAGWKLETLDVRERRLGNLHQAAHPTVLTPTERVVLHLPQCR
jgi:hypothetical protein